MDNYKTMDDISEELIIIPKATMDLLLKQTNPGDLIALCTFYYYIAKCQQTNKPKANNNYCMKGLGWGKDKFSKAKSKLKELKLIQDVTARNETTYKITGHYIHVTFI